MAGGAMRSYLLLVAALQMLSEGAKWLLGHKRALRAGRVKLYRQVLRSGLREHRIPATPEERVLLVTGEYPPARGGVGDYTCHLGAALRELGICAEVLTGDRGSGIGDRAPEGRKQKAEGSAQQAGGTKLGLPSALRSGPSGPRPLLTER